MTTHRQLDDPRRLMLHREAPKRDVPYVPTEEPVVAAMLRLTNVGPSDVVYDLGCGDGRIVLAAARLYGARGVGVDIDPLRIQECRENAQNSTVAGRVSFLNQSFFDVDLRGATVVTLYLLTGLNIRLRPKLLLELRPGSRIVSNYFEMGDWKPDCSIEVHHRILHLWTVPAWVAGTWTCVINKPDGRQRMILRLERRFQAVTGTAQVGTQELLLSDGKVMGDLLSFRLAGLKSGRGLTQYTCRVDGTRLRGICQGPGASPIAWCGMWKGDSRSS